MDNESTTTYTSFELMKIFGIKKGSWDYLKKKLNLDEYAERIKTDKKDKYIYTDEAYKILQKNYKEKVQQEVMESPKMMLLVQSNENLKAQIQQQKATLSEYKQISSKFETMYNEEKNKKESLLETNARLETANENFIHENHRLEGEKYDLQQEINRLKNRNFFERLFNK